MAFVQSNPFDPNVLFCNKAASSAFPEPTNYVIDLIQPTTVMLNQISKEGIKCKKCGKKKIGCQRQFKTDPFYLKTAK
ncbi:hypothetical protein [Acinetobacter sp. YH12021]|uniref:hypothetical protein n=1 Tax=Acinetobacter sp. YH12021 TaxID=2601040 RepID=UPI0015D243A3|nr:hypothetical protein [Acinetobacter sp. YH12021]